DQIDHSHSSGLAEQVPTGDVDRRQGRVPQVPVEERDHPMTLMEGFQFTRIGADHVGRELPDQACYGSSPHGLSPAAEPVIRGHLDYGAGLTAFGLERSGAPAAHRPAHHADPPAAVLPCVSPTAA